MAGLISQMHSCTEANELSSLSGSTPFAESHRFQHPWRLCFRASAAVRTQVDFSPGGNAFEAGYLGDGKLSFDAQGGLGNESVLGQRVTINSIHLSLYVRLCSSKPWARDIVLMLCFSCATLLSLLS
ncbi:hypothetical protein EUGRSUZ_B02484 [Eucalyptus grandis]|uniref:Uncharacterized protein n=2 Tax=Eucalyptus grandis TaxID=71139 RepID=A0ACC3LTX2_EUCGR|nr:hypothetical protein EUGRSUZ_B02484 [Eucalyptus grandis]